MQAYTIATTNINKITSDLKLACLKEFLYESGTDIALLQEVWTTNLKIPGYVEILNVCSITNTGTAFLIREGISVTNDERLESGRAISVEILSVFMPLRETAIDH